MLGAAGIIFVLASLGLGAGLGFFLGKKAVERAQRLKKQAAESFIEEAKRKAEDIKRKAELDAKEMLYKLRVDFEAQTEAKRKELEVLEKRILQREENLEKRVEFFQQKEAEVEKMRAQLKDAEQTLEKKNHQLNDLLAEEKKRLQEIAYLNINQARDLLLKRIESEMTVEKAEILKRKTEEIKQESDKIAKDIISLAIKRCAVEHTQDTTVSVVSLPNDEMKGRIIGREGRNIRTLEMATGVDVIIDDTPEAVTISGFDPIRREIARLTLEKLVSDGRIHPARIEETVEKVKKEFEKAIMEEGKNLCFDVDVHNLNPELMRLLGKLKYRTSFGQNALQHSKEVALLMGGLAAELGLDARLAKRIGLLHDIGKAIDQQVEGTHALLGADLARKYGEKEIVLNAIAAHHEEVEPRSIYAVLAAAADAISASRPGARRETLETYIKRLKNLEAIADSFPGVEKSFAIQAGREIRIMVKSDQVDDSAITVLARDIKNKIEEEMDYPGQIKVTVIRETRAVDYAK